MRCAMVLALCAAATAQDSTTDGSVGRSSVLLANGRLPSPEEVQVYDFVNYHPHDLPAPAAGQAVSLDARLLRDALPAGDTETVLQIGFRTHRIDLKEVRPMNVAVVIDRSGSMASDEKLEYVKQAMEIFLTAFDEDDLLAIVVYDSEASVLRASEPVKDRRAIAEQIRAIQPGSSTNLHGGLMLGLREVAGRYDAKRANRVILLSDGMANEGVVDGEQIIRETKAFTDRGVDLTTVGIGLAYNDALMRGLAGAGRGTYHFLDSGREIERVFGHFLQSLIEKAARRPRVTVTLSEGVAVRHVHGYEHATSGRALSFELLDMPLSLTQVIPIELSVAAGATAIASVRLDYRDERAGKDVSEGAVVGLARGEGRTDAGVMKNVTIARLAAAVRQACAKPDTTGRDVLKDALLRAETLYTREPKDAAVKRVMDLATGALLAVEHGVKGR